MARNYWVEQAQRRRRALVSGIVLSVFMGAVQLAAQFYLDVHVQFIWTYLGHR